MTPVPQPQAPVLVPTADGQHYAVNRVFCVGRNYADHVREMGGSPDRDPPVYFTKWASAIAPGGGAIAYPPMTRDFHYELELVVALASGGHTIALADALDCVWGYAVGLDMTRRDLQGLSKTGGMPWDVAKNFEQAAPLGVIHPKAALGAATNGRIHLTVNGTTRQDANLSDLIWSVGEIIADLSRYYRLLPGDVIFTGTPAGVGPVVPGDRLVGMIDGLSPLDVTIEAA